jgi:hypothetical protein
VEKAEHGVPIDQEGKLIDANQAKLTLWIYGEPSVRLLEVREPPVFDELVDDKDQVAVATCFSDTALLREQITSAGMGIKLTFPGVPGEKIASMRGKEPVTILLRSETLTTGSLADGKPQSQKAGDISVIFEGFTKRPLFQSTPTIAIQNYTMAIQFSRSGMDAITWKKLAHLLPTMVPAVLAADGRALLSHAGEISGPQDGLESIRVVYQMSGKVENLVPDIVRLEVPLEIQEIGVPFEFKDIVIQ